MLDLKLFNYLLGFWVHLTNDKIVEYVETIFFFKCAKNHINTTFAEEFPQLHANVLFETVYCELHVL